MPVLSGLGISSLCGGSNFSAALTHSGEMYMWGTGFYGQCGQDVSLYGSFQSTPQRVIIDGHRITSIAAGTRHVAVVATRDSAFDDDEEDELD
jgi:alpha-tubulin suppressor-like RCC1 family protein